MHGCTDIIMLPSIILSLASIAYIVLQYRMQLFYFGVSYLFKEITLIIALVFQVLYY